MSPGGGIRWAADPGTSVRCPPIEHPVSNVLSDTLSELVEQGLPIVACTADLKYSNGLVRFQERYPDRFLQFGISEQNMVTAAAGLATTGLEVYAATFASFLALLCCEQIRTDVAYVPPACAADRPPFGYHARLLRDLAPRDGGSGHHAIDRGADGRCTRRRRFARRN